MTSTTNLVTELALALTLRFFADEPKLDDVRMLVRGRVHLWPRWDSDRDARRMVARFLAVRPDDLAEDRAFLECAREVLLQASEFEATGGQDEGRPTWSTTYALVRGAPLDARIDQWFSQVEKQRSKSAAAPAERPSAGVLTLVGGDLTYRIPHKHAPKSPDPPPALRTSPSVQDELLDREALVALARAIDGAGEPGSKLYESVGIEAFLDRFISEGGVRATIGPAGVTKLALAPTGTGKSVFARLFALHLARRGVPVALVVPDIQAVWTETLRVRAASRAAGLGLSVVPLSSWRSLGDRLGAYLDHPPKEDPDAAWALRAVGYTCLLAAYVGLHSFLEPDEPATLARERATDFPLLTRPVLPLPQPCAWLVADRWGGAVLGVWPRPSPSPRPRRARRRGGSPESGRSLTGRVQCGEFRLKRPPRAHPARV